MDKKDAKRIQKQVDQLFKTLTTPEAITEFIREFCGSLSDQEPFFIECEPETWSRQRCCDLNVKEYIRIQGQGTLQYGFRVWYNKQPVYVEAESHVIWRDRNELRDVSFSADGEKRTLFLPAYSTFIGILDDIPKKTRRALLGADRRALAIFEEFEKSTEILQYPDDVAWDVMPTWEEWQSGKRAPTTVVDHGLGFDPFATH